MSSPDLLERVRMCLAEVGVDQMFAVEVDEFGGIEFEWNCPDRVAWRAAELGRAPDGLEPICWVCSEDAWHLPAHAYRMRRHACLATRPCMEDCGRDRGES